MKQKMTEQEWDKKLNIQTTGRDDSQEDEYHYPYEPTPYVVLQRLMESEYITAENQVVDYGCGKGRVGFFLNSMLRCSVIGIEYDEKIYRQAMQNRKTYAKAHSQAMENQKTYAKAHSQAMQNQKGYGEKYNVTFVCANAEEYQVEDADSFYFFNPFSVEILRSVIGKIIDSYYAEPREMLLFFYYPNDEYLSFLMTEPMLSFVDEIDCQDLYKGKNERERILIFEVG